MIEKGRILIVEDSPALGHLYGVFLEAAGYEVVHVLDGVAGLEVLSEDPPPDVVLLDLQLPDIPGMEILDHLVGTASGTAAIITTAHGSVEQAVEAIQKGAHDFLEKPFDGHRLRTTVANAIRASRLKRLAVAAPDAPATASGLNFVGTSEPMQLVYKTITSCAESTASVLITGESGTGKEVCAEAIHNAGPRKDSPFVALNCAALPADLVESELFGHRRGAFTGAVSDYKGACSRADGGTLFLDEIGEMRLDLQSKILRFVQFGRFRPIGGEETSVDVRIIAATNRSPLDEVTAGRFREDLFYRLNVVPIAMPPLRQRGGDILLLAHHFLKRFAVAEGKRFRELSPEVEDAFLGHSWPGNVRQLQNAVHNIVVLHDGEIVTRQMLPRSVFSSAETVTTLNGPATIPQPGVHREPPGYPVRPLEVIEREAIETAIDCCDGNILRAASLLCVHPSTIYRKRKQWNEAECG